MAGCQYYRDHIGVIPGCIILALSRDNGKRKWKVLLRVYGFIYGLHRGDIRSI